MHLAWHEAMQQLEQGAPSNHSKMRSELLFLQRAHLQGLVSEMMITSRSSSSSSKGQRQQQWMHHSMVLQWGVRLQSRHLQPHRRRLLEGLDHKSERGRCPLQVAAAGSPARVLFKLVMQEKIFQTKWEYGT